MTIITRRMLLLPYTDSLQLEFVMLKCRTKSHRAAVSLHTVSSAKQLFESVLDGENIHSMAVLDSASRDYMGHVFVSHLDQTPELGFMFAEEYWGKGLATEALKAYFPKACNELGLSKIHAHVDKHHNASINVLNKLGFKVKSSAGMPEVHFPDYLQHWPQDCIEMEFINDVVEVQSVAV